MDIDKDIITAIKPEMVSFYTKMRENEDMFNVMCEGAEQYGEEGEATYWFNLFLQIWLKRQGVKGIVDFLNEKVDNEEKVKNFVYNLIKLDYKSKVGMWVLVRDRRIWN
jgi:hypothetical protein